MNGVSKKLCISIIGVQAIVQMAADATATDKFRYALLITGIVILYKLVQAFMDWWAMNKTGKAE